MAPLLLLGLGIVVAAGEDASRGPEWVDARIERWQPTERERRWWSIGWAEGLLPARRLAAEHNRPIFLFTLDGHMDVGRC